MTHALAKLAYDVVILDVGGLCSYTDAIIVCHGTSTRQAATVAEYVIERMKKEKLYPLGREGEREGQWVVIDYGDVVMHIFYEPIRTHYDLEGVWADAPRGRATASAEGVHIVWPRKKRKSPGQAAESDAAAAE
ncbi:MAG: ribosome silencing factor [Deltaproteobacteria bacterium]|nr:ribosome silencing factor [Deltaproteobacteria bacterium]